MPAGATESALLLVCPAAEQAAAEHRARLDRAAQDGIPAHVTVLYPFPPLDLLTADDHERLTQVAATSAAFTVCFGRTGWFGDGVLYLAPDDPAPMVDLTRAVTAAFPDFPPYAGEFSGLVPHLTVGHGHPRGDLEAAERSVSLRLHVTQRLDHVQLWAGPALAGRTRPAPWRHVRSYRLRDPAWVR